MSGLGKIASGILGVTGSTPKIRAPQFQGITTPSLSLSPQGTLTRLDQLVPKTEEGILQRLASTEGGILSRLPGIRGLKTEADKLTRRTAGFFDRTAGLTGTLQNQLQQLRPGFSRITESRVQGVRNAASQAVGNVRSALEKRNLLGSSFANQQISQIQSEFAQQEDKVRAEALIQEFQAQDQIVGEIGNLLQLDQRTLQQQVQNIALQLGLNEADGQVFAQAIGALQTELAVVQGRTTRELTELGVSGNIINKVNAIASQVATAQAKLDAEAAIARGESFSNIFTGLEETINPLSSYLSGSQSILSGQASAFRSPDFANQVGQLPITAAQA